MSSKPKTVAKNKKAGSNKPEKTFSKDIKLTEGNNIINIAVTYSIQNKTT